MMLSEGSQNYSSEELNRSLDYYGVFLNQSAERDNAGIVLFSLTNTLKKFWNSAVRYCFVLFFLNRN